MPRKRDIPKKKIIPDPIYKSTNVTRLTNMIMQDGKKRTAEKIVYEALFISSKKTKKKLFFFIKKGIFNRHGRGVLNTENKMNKARNAAVKKRDVC